MILRILSILSKTLRLGASAVYLLQFDSRDNSRHLPVLNL